MSDINAIGDSAELLVGGKMREIGAQVSFPFGDNAPYDLIIDIGGSLYRVQIKTTSQREDENGSVRAPLRRGNGSSYGYEEVDAYVLHNRLDDEYYWLWTDECAETVARVCTDSPEEVYPPNRERATFAKNVLLSKRLAELQN